MKYAALTLAALLAACGGGGGDEHDEEKKGPKHAQRPKVEHQHTDHSHQTPLPPPPPIEIAPEPAPLVTEPAVEPVVEAPVVAPRPALQPSPVLAPKELRNPANRLFANTPDLSTDNMVQIVYAVPRNAVDRALDLSPNDGAITDWNIATMTGAWNNWFAQQSGGMRFRLDTLQDGVTLDVTYVALEQEDRVYDEALGTAYKIYAVERELRRRLPMQPNKIYVVYYEGFNTRCADTTDFNAASGAGQVVMLYLKGQPVGQPPCESNAFAFRQGDVPKYPEFVVLHELVHIQGFVSPKAPDAVAGNHVSTPYDLMYWGPLPWYVRGMDPDRRNYFNPSGPLPGGLPNLADSPYLTKGQP